MASTSRLGSARGKVREHRQRLREQGLSYPDLGSGCSLAAFRQEAHRRSLAVAGSSQAHHGHAFIDAIAD
jgi:hypothetical protein